MRVAGQGARRSRVGLGRGQRDRQSGLAGSAWARQRDQPDAGTQKQRLQLAKLVGAGFGPGVLGPDQAFSFAGAEQRVVFNQFGGNRRRADFTFAFYIKTTATHPQAVWEKRVSCNPHGTFLWEFRMTGRIGFGLFTGSTLYIAESTTTISDGNWHLVVATRDGVTISLYVDGNLEATTTSATTVNVINDARMRMGVSKCDGIDGTHPFIGKLDELMIFRTAFTQQQIQALARPTG